MDGCPPEWGPSSQDFRSVRLNFLIFTEQTFLIRIKRDLRFFRGQATKEEIRDALCYEDYNERDDALD